MIFMKYGIFGIAGLTSCIMATQAIADQMHYRNIIIGERAQGLAGAYVGVADDASGVYYNPAGLAFAQSNDISGSANAFYAKKAVYKKAILGKEDWIEESGGTFAPFFGAMQKLDKYVPGLVGGFAYFTTDTELKDQENIIQNKYDITRYHRSANQRAATYTAAGALGYRVSPTLGLGLGLGYLKADELLQISENLVYTNFYLLKSTRDSLVAHGVVASFGVQWAPSSKVAVGFTAKSGMYASQKLNQVIDKLQLSTEGIKSSPREVASSNPLGSVPIEIRGGLAWFASPRYLLTADFDWHEAIDDMSSDTESVYKREAVLNYAIGSEYYVTPSLPIRAGFFTNYDATPMPKAVDRGYGQPDHIDYMGATLFLALAQPTSQLSAGAVFQQGTGKAEKSTLGVLQDVEATAYTLAFSATHSF
jgi:long-chain fatty acid transport protein